MAISLNAAQLHELKKALKNADLEPRKKQRLLWRIAKMGAIPAIKRYIKNQLDVEGLPLEKRKNKKRRLLLKDMPKLVRIKELPHLESVRLYFSGKYKSSLNQEINAGVIAAVHQNGLEITQRKEQFQKMTDKNGQTQTQKNREPISKSQIKKLRTLGFTIPSNGKAASKKWMQDNLSRAQAGLILRKLLNKEAKSIWKINMPSREFFGISDEDFSKSLARELKNIGFGWNVKAQDIKNRGK